MSTPLPRPRQSPGGVVILILVQHQGAVSAAVMLGSPTSDGAQACSAPAAGRALDWCLRSRNDGRHGAVVHRRVAAKVIHRPRVVSLPSSTLGLTLDHLSLSSAHVRVADEAGRG